MKKEQAIKDAEKMAKDKNIQYVVYLWKKGNYSVMTAMSAMLNGVQPVYKTK